MLSVVAARYARAFADVVTSPKSGVDPAMALDQLRSVQLLIDGSASLRTALASPAVAPSKKRAVMTRLLEPMKVSEKVRNFVYVVVDHRRVHEFPSIVDGFESLLDERMGVIAADVSSAKPLSGPQQNSLTAQLSRLTGKKAKPKFAVDPALIAGAVARVGGVVYDGSVRGQLESLRTKLGAR